MVASRKQIISLCALVKFWGPSEVWKVQFVKNSESIKLKLYTLILAVESWGQGGSFFELRDFIYVLKGWYNETHKKVPLTLSPIRPGNIAKCFWEL